jgi:hypothetical protein
LAVSIAGKEDVLEVGDDGHTPNILGMGGALFFSILFFSFPYRVVVPV